MKRIGILTFHRANNLGAVLQAAALCRYLNEHVGNTEIIDFVPNNNVPRNFPGMKILRKLKLGIITLKKDSSVIRTEKFEKFQHENYTLSAKTYYGDQGMAEADGKYDLLISGSDQILNTTLSGCSESFYLAFEDKAEKISYASSFGRTEITDEEKRLIRAELPKFKALSFREESGRKIVNELTGVDGTVVVDPVFLLSREDWEKRCNGDRSAQKYLFVYAMEATPVLLMAILESQKKFQLPVVMVKGGSQYPDIEARKDDCCGPGEFLLYIRNAECVITNSFHGTAFSIIFGRKLICVAHSKRNARLESIVELTGNTGKIVEPSTEAEKVMEMLIDGEKGYLAMSGMIEESKRYLQQSVK